MQGTITQAMKIWYDTDPTNPRENDNVGTMVCWHNRHNLGDEQPKYGSMDFLHNLDFSLTDTECLDICWDIMRNYAEHWDDFVYMVKKHSGDIYDASVQNAIEYIGIVPKALADIIDREYVILPLYLYDHSGITISCSAFSCPWDSGQIGYIYCKSNKENLSAEHIERILRAEVSEYDLYLSGQCYGYTLYKDGEEIDTCGGFLGDIKENGILDYIGSDYQDLALEAWDHIGEEIS